MISAVAIIDGPYQFSTPDGSLKTVKAYRFVDGPATTPASILDPGAGFQGTLLDQPAHR